LFIEFFREDLGIPYPAFIMMPTYKKDIFSNNKYFLSKKHNTLVAVAPAQNNNIVVAITLNGPINLTRL